MRKSGKGVAASPASVDSVTPNARSRYSPVVEKLNTESTADPVVPKPVRRNKRAVAFHSADCTIRWFLSTSASKQPYATRGVLADWHAVQSD